MILLFRACEMGTLEQHGKSSPAPARAPVFDQEPAQRGDSLACDWQLLSRVALAGSDVKRGLLQCTGRDGTAFSAVAPSERPAGVCGLQSAHTHNVQRLRWFGGTWARLSVRYAEMRELSAWRAVVYPLWFVKAARIFCNVRTTALRRMSLSVLPSRNRATPVQIDVVRPTAGEV